LSLRTVFYGILILLLLYGLFTVGFPFLLAFLLAFLLEPVILYISKEFKIKRSYSSVLVCTVFTLILLALSYFLVAKVAREAEALSRAMLSFIRDFNQGIDQISVRYSYLFETLPPEYQSSLQQIASSLLESMQTFLRQSISFSFNIARQIPNIFIELLIVFIAMYLISLRLPHMKQSFMRFFDESNHSRLDSVLKQLQQAVFGFIRAQIIISSIEFFFVLFGFLILGVSYPSATALLVTIVDFLPILGTGAVMIPMAFYQYLSGDLFLSVGLLVHYAVIIIFRRIIDPKILADNIGISSLSALISMYLGIKLVGVVGLFMGPAVVILFQAMNKVGLLKLKVKF